MQKANWQAKLLYFTVSMAVCSMNAFAPSFLADHWHLDPADLGIVAMTTGMLFLGSLAWAAVADEYRRPRLVAIGCTVANALAMMSLLWMPVTSTWALAWTTGVFAAGNFFVAALFPIVDAEVMRRLSPTTSTSYHAAKKETFGKLRLWGTIGHAAVVFASAYAIEWIKYPGMFGVMAASCASFVVAALIGINNPPPLPASTTAARPGGKSGSTWMMLSRLYLVAKNGRFMIFLGVVMVIGWVRAILGFWLTYYLTNVLGLKPTHLAWANAVRVSSELLVFYFAREMREAVGSTGMLAVSQVAGIVRIAAYGWVDVSGNRWYATFAFEILKGLQSSTFTAAAVELANYLVTNVKHHADNPRPAIMEIKDAGEAKKEDKEPIQMSEVKKGASVVSLEVAQERDHRQQADVEQEERLRQESRTLAQGCLYGIYNGLSGTVAGLTGSVILRYGTNRDVAALFRVGTAVSTTAFAVYVALVVWSRQKPQRQQLVAKDDE